MEEDLPFMNIMDFSPLNYQEGFLNNEQLGIAEDTKSLNLPFPYSNLPTLVKSDYELLCSNYNEWFPLKKTYHLDCFNKMLAEFCLKTQTITRVTTCRLAAKQTKVYKCYFARRKLGNTGRMQQTMSV